MRILMIASVDPAVPNASVTHLDGVASVLTNQGHDVTLVMPRAKGGKPVWSEGAKPYRIQYLPYGGRLGIPRFLCSLIHAPWIAAKIRRFHPDLIYVRSSTLSAITTVIAQTFGNGTVITEHNGWISDELQTQGRPRWMQRMARQLQVWDARASDVARCVTAGLARKFREQRVADDKLLVAGNGTDLDRFQPMERGLALATWGLPADRFYLGFIGSLAPWHGLMVAVRAMATIVAAEPRAHLLVAGDGVDRKPAEALAHALNIADRITFLGHIPPEQAPTAINCFDLALAPFVSQRNSSIGLSALKVRDYAASARAILSTDIEGVAPLDDRNWIALCQPDDAAAYAQAALRLMADPVELHRLGEAARRYAENNFGWAAIVGAILRAAQAVRI